MKKKSPSSSKPASSGPVIQSGDPKTLPPPLELSKRYMRLQNGDINGALSILKEETQMLDLRIKPLVRGMKCAGIAATWNAVLAVHDPIPREMDVFKKWRKITDCIVPGSVFVYQPGGEMNSGHLGNLYGNMIAARGARGAVVDGNLRDSDAHERIPRWTAFSRGTSPLEAAPQLKWMEANTPILMSGELRRWITVHPGDMVSADGDGVIIIPRRLIMPALLQAEKTRSNEIKAEKEYAAGADPDKVAKKYGVA
jgi:regulator of RNase E activity RraA